MYESWIKIIWLKKQLKEYLTLVKSFYLKVVYSKTSIFLFKYKLIRFI